MFYPFACSKKELTVKLFWQHYSAPPQYIYQDSGGFQLLDLIIPELKSHVIPYKFMSSHWLKLQHSDWRANLVKDFFLQINFPPMRALEFIRDHTTFKLRYNQI